MVSGVFYRNHVMAGTLVVASRVSCILQPHIGQFLRTRRMATQYSRARLGAAVVTAFACGLLFASSFDLTRFGFAQDGKSARSRRRRCRRSRRTGNAFEAIADHVTPSVVSIQTQRVRNVSSRMRSPRGQQPPGIEEFFRNFEQQPQQQAPQESSGTGSSSRRTATSSPTITSSPTRTR